MANLVLINNKEIHIKEYQNQRVITFKDIDTVHERPEGTAGRNFNANKDRFIKGTDYFHLSYEDLCSTKFVERPNPQGVTFLTESGYLMLVKSLTDDLAWQVQRELVNGYFRSKQPARTDEIGTKRANAMLLNAQTKKAKLMLAAAEAYKDILSPVSSSLLINEAMEVLTGKTNLLPLPEIEKTYTATEIAEEAGVSSNKIGKLANAHGLKTSEYGVTVLDKSPHSSKQVPTFRYNEKGRVKLLNLLKQIAKN